MNAIRPHHLETDPARETAEEQKTRHLRTCQELIELGMNLARDATAHAQRDMAAPPPDLPMPCSAAAALEQAEHRARQRTPNYAVVFTRLARAVRQTIALQAHIAAGAPLPDARAPNPHQTPAREPRTDRTTHPDRPASHRNDIERPDWILTPGPDGELPVEELLQAIREDLALIANPDHRHAQETGERPKRPPW